jgi:hypothetical protein
MLARERRLDLVMVALVAVAYGAACWLVRLAGFDHVSDDDFARATIAQTFAVAPRLDPSGTSWLPFPFWSTGILLAATNRSLEMARAASIAIASVAAAAPYAALRSAGVDRTAALGGTLLAFVSPWALWLGATTVPESPTASLVAAGAIGLSAGRWRLAPLWAMAIVAACLSRYEAWPIAAVLALALGARAVREREGQETRWGVLLLAAACAAGPIAWMAWNAHAHDGPLHFFRRVSAFKRAIGEGSTDTLDALLLYPRLLLTSRPEVTFPALLLLPRLRDPGVRRRWALPIAAVAAEVVFLAYGNVRDGAPAHHPERALLGVFVVLAFFVVDVGRKVVAAFSRPRRLTAAACVGVLWLASVVRDASDVPGTASSDDRSGPIARGRALRAAGATHLHVTPCAFEHFALLAAYAAPERAEIAERTNAPISPDCPRVEVLGP